MKIKIENYQVIKYAELEFVKGLNVIVGNTNNGKSSIIRAIRGAINNQGGNFFINYDAESTTVNIEYKGQNIIWDKTKKSGGSSYIINGTTLNKIGQKQIPEVAEIMNMREVSVGTERFQINFWQQLEKPFLVDKTPYQLFDFISKSKEQEVVVELQDKTDSEFKEINSNINITQAQINTKTSEITTLETEIKNLEKYNELNIEQLELKLNFKNRISKLLDDLEKTNNELIKHENEITTISKQVTNLTSTIDILEEKIGTLIGLRSRFSSLDKLLPNFNTNKELSKKISFKVNPLEKLVLTLGLNIPQVETASVALDKLITTTQNLHINKNKLLLIEDTYIKLKNQLATFEVCPLCSGPINKETGEHLHG